MFSATEECGGRCPGRGMPRFPHASPEEKIPSIRLVASYFLEEIQ